MVRLVTLAAACTLAGPGVTRVDATCSIGGTATLPPPSVTHLRSYRASFATPSRLATDAAGNIYVVDPGRGEVLVRGADGHVARRVALERPISIAVSEDRIFVGRGTGAVSVFDLDWTSSFTFGGDRLGQPADLSFDPVSDRLFVADTPHHLIQVFDGTGAFLFSFGGEGSADGQLSFPAGVFVDVAAREVLVADRLNYRVQIFTLDGIFLSCFGAQGSAPGRFNMPEAVLTDQLGRVYVADALEGRLQVLERSGAPLATIGDFGEGAGRLRIPVGIAIDPSHRLLVGNANNARLEMYGLDAFTDPETIVPGTLALDPPALDRAAPPPRLALHLELPGVRREALSLLRPLLNGVAPAANSLRVGDADGNGVPDLRIDIDSASLLATLPGDGTKEVLATGNLSTGLRFEAAATLGVTTCAPTTHCPLEGADPQCNEAACDPEVGCLVEPKLDGTGCEDGDACSVDDVCTGGTCGGEPLACDDHNPCTDDSCDPRNGCTYVDNSAACDDADACTVNDVCAAATCAGTPRDCDDGDPCTDDSCDSASGCGYAFNAAPCDDGDACTTGDTCAAGVCGGAARSCDDGNPCTDDSCDPESGCRAVDNAAFCDDGDACTWFDRCDSGGCVGEVRSCDDDNPCTDDGCDPLSGCSHADNVDACDDGDPGTAADVCTPGGNCSGRVANGDFAILGWSQDGARRHRLSIGRRARVTGDVCAETILLRPFAEIDGDLIAGATSGHAVAFQRGNRISGDVVSGGGTVGPLGRADIGGRIDRSGDAAELGVCAAALWHAGERRAALRALPSDAGAPDVSVNALPGETLRLPSSGTLPPGTAIVDADDIYLGPGSVLQIAPDDATESLVVRVAGHMIVGRGAHIDSAALTPERVLFVVAGAVSVERNGAVDGTLFAANRMRLGIASRVHGAVVANSIDLSPLASVENHPFVGW